MKHWQTSLTILAALFASTALADDFKTLDGKEFKNATVTRVEPDGIIVKMKSGISKLYFVELPKEVQQRFHYDPQTATAYSAQQAAHYEVYQKQREEVRNRQEDADAQNNATYLQQQAINRNAQALQDRELASQQANQGKQPQPTHAPPRTTKVLHRLPQTQPPTPTPVPSAPPKTPNNPTTPNKPVHHAAAPESHSKSQGKKAHK